MNDRLQRSIFVLVTACGVLSACGPSTGAGPDDAGIDPTPVSDGGTRDAGTEAGWDGGHDAGTTQPVHQASATIGPGGGTIDVEGASLVVPEGATASEAVFTVTRTDLPVPDAWQGYSPVYRFESTETSFAKPLTIEIAYSGTEAYAVLAFSPDGSTYEQHLGTRFGGWLITQVAGLGNAFVANGVLWESAATPCVTCGESCVDLTSNAEHCGECGIACGPDATCEQGQCAVPLTPADHSVGTYDLNPSHVFWIYLDTIYRAPLAGGSPSSLGALNIWPGWVAADENHVYWTENYNAIANNNTGGIYRRPVSGGAREAVAQSQHQPSSIALDATAVFWTTESIEIVPGNPLPAGVRRANKTGGTTTLTTAVYPRGIRVDGTHAYFIELFGAGWRVPKQGGTAERLTTEVCGDLTGDASETYWTEHNAGFVRARAKTDGRERLIAPGQQGARYLATDGEHLYWSLQQETQRLVRVPVTGGTPRLIAEDPDRHFGSIELDADYVYWTNGRVMRRLK